jgi:putative transposase
MPKRATAIHLSEQEREELTRLTKRSRSEQQVVLRARIILASAQGASNAQIARDLQINVDTVRLWRDRWAKGQESDHEEGSPQNARLVHRLQDAPRPGAMPKFTVDQRAQMAALACEAPAKTGRPISQWTGREIADELKQRGIVTEISPRHAARLLKKGASNRTAFGTGSQRKKTRSGKRRSSRGAKSMPKPPSEPNTENAPSAWMS